MKPLGVLCCLLPLLAIPARGASPSDRAVPSDLGTLVQANNAFALDLYARLCAKEGNLFFSQYSISTALGDIWCIHVRR